MMGSWPGRSRPLPLVGFQGRERTSPARKAESKVEMRREEKMWVA